MTAHATQLEMTFQRRVNCRRYTLVPAGSATKPIRRDLKMPQAGCEMNYAVTLDGLYMVMPGIGGKIWDASGT